MGGERGGRLSGRQWLLVGTLILLALVLAASTVLDRDPRGRVRVATLPAALTLLDPFTWKAFGNSLAVAGTTTLLALLFGAPLAGLLPRERSWLRRALLPWVVLPALLPVPVLVLGLLQVLPPGDRLAFPASWASGLGLGPLRIAGAWPLLVWINLVVGLPMVLIATLRARDRLDPRLADAAVALGATRARVALTVVWPLLRPSALRASGLVFGLSLFEPAAPLLLPARRTLAFQIIEAAATADLPRASTLTLLGLLAVATVHTLFRLRAPLGTIPEAPLRVVRPALTWPRTFRLLVACLLWLAMAWTPTVRLAASVLREFRSRSEFPLDAGFGRVALSSLAIGLVVALLSLVLVRPDSRSGPIGWLRRCPPMAMAVALLAVPGVLRLLADTGLTLGFLEAFGNRLDPYRASGVLLVIALALVHLPLSHRVLRLAVSRTDPAHQEAAWTLGASERRARRDTVIPLVAPVLLRAAILVGILAATDVAAALLLIPLPGSFPVGPAMVDLTLQPDPSRASRLAVLAALAVMASFLLASGTRFWGPDADARPSSPRPPEP